MNSEPQPGTESAEPPPLAQRLFDNWLVLMIAGIAVMVLVYTAWGFFEILSLPPATLP